MTKNFFGKIAANARTYVGRRFLKIGCISLPKSDNKRERAPPIWILTSRASSGDMAASAKTITKFGTSSRICFNSWY